MPREAKDGKAAKAKEVKAEAAPDMSPDGAAQPKGKNAIDEVISAIEAARDKVMADEVKGLTKLGIPRAMAYQMVAARFHQTVVTDGEGGGPEFENSHWTDR